MALTTKKFLIFSFTFLISLAIYGVTLSSEVGFEDSAELTLQAYQLGVTHPPGHPLHTILGHALMVVFPDAATATNCLSALATSATVGLLSVMFLDATGILCIALLVPLVYAVSPRVWTMAVTTEVYNVNALFLALSLYCVQCWNRRLSWRAVVGAAVFYGLSLGVYLANALLLPAFVCLLWRPQPRRANQFAAATGIVLALAVAMLGYTVVRSHTLPPLGSMYLPTTLADGVKFFSGSQFKPAEPLTLDFYLERPLDHARAFAKNFLLIGIPIGMVGVAALWRSDRRMAIFYLLLLAINLGYFTFYYVDDYYLMVSPSYLVFAILIAHGFAAMWNRAAKLNWLLGALMVLMCVVMVAIQFRERRENATSYPVTEFARSSFNAFPPNALVISRWSVFPPLLYFQTTAGARPDCTLIARSDIRNYYGPLVVENYLSYLREQIGTRPIVIDKADPNLRAEFQITRLDANWFLVEPRPESARPGEEEKSER